jgi:hypothetical protein
VLAKKTTSGVRFYKKIGLGKSPSSRPELAVLEGAFACAP